VNHQLLAITSFRILHFSRIRIEVGKRQQDQQVEKFPALGSDIGFMTLLAPSVIPRYQELKYLT
jgi:hypothetical protein